MDESILARYNSVDGAKSYTRKWEKHWTERLNNRTEQALVKRILERVGDLGPNSVGLDLPCGYGRLAPLASRNVGRLVEGDWSFHLLCEAREFLGETAVARPLGFVRGTALNLPFPDATFDLVLSARLCHHISREDERLRYVHEMLRIGRGWVVFTYFDTYSLKNRLHSARRRFNGKREKWTLSNEQVRTAADNMNYEVIDLVPLSRLFSGHRFAVLRRNP